MPIKTLKTADIQGKRVLLRVDFNVPIENGVVKDDTRIRETLPTIRYLLEQQAKIIIMSHLGRPEKDQRQGFTMDPVAQKLQQFLELPVKKVDDCIGPVVEEAVFSAQPGSIIVLENTRFYPEEEECERNFCKQLAKLGEVFVLDAFGTAHRKHASTYGVGEYLPSYAGLLMEKEVTALQSVIENEPRPLTLIMGGAKIDTKIGILRNFLSKADYILLGGGLANTFLAAQGFDIGNSLYEPDKLDVAREIMLEAEVLQDRFVLPSDAIVADEISDDVTTLDLPVTDVSGSMKILDIGTMTMKRFSDVIQHSLTIIWNGPVGLFEKKPFQKGTEVVARALANAKHARTILGGGDTLDALQHFNIPFEEFSHVSTGGGAMLEFLEGKELPGVQLVTGS